LLALALVSSAALVPLPAQTWPVPPEISAGTHFTVTLDGRSTPVMHAAMNIDFLNFPVSSRPGRKIKVTVTADNDEQWSKGVEVEPWRLGIRPVRSGRTLSFEIENPGQITITQPNDVLFAQPTLLLFANPVEKDPPSADRPGLRYIGPGAHTENIDVASGDNVYLAPGAVVFGSLNVWQADDVHVFGRGVIVYDGPQNPDNDDGWMHRKNWHCIVMDDAHDISIEGITCVVRSRTWQIQMKGSRNIVFDNIKVIGANKGNANADGMDWLDGSGDTVVKNSFFRAADDVFALQESWEGYGPVAFAVQGHPVGNIDISNVEVSTSISNIVRAAWPEKNFEGGHFHMRDSDVLHMGMGGCGIPFALMELWADPHGRGSSSDYTFDDIRLEHWSALELMEQSATPGPAFEDHHDQVSGARFTNISALELPSLTPSVLQGAVKDVAFQSVNLAGTVAQSDAQLPVQVLDGAAEPSFSAPLPALHIVTPPGLIKPGQKITLQAASNSALGGFTFDWTFGDGSHASGRNVKHRFSDTAGTLLDRSGRFRIVLHAITPAGQNLYVSSPVLVADALAAPSRPPFPSANSGVAASDPAPISPGLHYTYTYTYTYTEPDTAATASGIAQIVSAAPLRQRPQNYTLAFDGFVNIPADGGYTFTLVANEPSTLTLDGKRYTTPAPFPNVCNLAGDAPQTVTLYAALARGPHTLSISSPHTTGVDSLRLLWQPPNQPVTDVPASALVH
jgi:hypothetical protein